jgi:hypothetical protein
MSASFISLSTAGFAAAMMFLTPSAINHNRSNDKTDDVWTAKKRREPEIISKIMETSSSPISDELYRNNGQTDKEADNANHHNDVAYRALFVRFTHLVQEIGHVPLPKGALVAIANRPITHH